MDGGHAGRAARPGVVGGKWRFVAFGRKPWELGAGVLEAVGSCRACLPTMNLGVVAFPDRLRRSATLPSVALPLVARRWFERVSVMLAASVFMVVLSRLACRMAGGAWLACSFPREPQAPICRQNLLMLGTAR